MVHDVVVPHARGSYDSWHIRGVPRTQAIRSIASTVGIRWLFVKLIL